MAEETNNHNLNMYSQGETGWTHSPDMSHIEENLPIVDTASNRTTYTPYNGVLFFATDTDEVYEGDGSQWNHVSWDVSQISKNGNPVATENWVNTNFGSWSDLEGIPNTFTPEEHGSGAHDGTVASSTDLENEILSHISDDVHDQSQPAIPSSLDGTSIGESQYLQLVNTYQAYIGETAGRNVPIDSRPVISNSATTVSVPGDYATIQEAVAAVPMFLRHSWKIELDPTTHYGEEVEIPPVIGGDADENGRGVSLEIVSNTDPENNHWSVDAMRVWSPHGNHPVQLFGPEFRNTHTSDGYDPCLVVRGGGEVQVINPQFRNVSANSASTKEWGIVPYASHVHLQGVVDFGTEELQNGIHTAHGGRVTSQADQIIGTTRQAVVRQVNGQSVLRNLDATAQSGNDVTTGQGGSVHIGDYKGLKNVVFGTENQYDTNDFLVHNDTELTALLNDHNIPNGAVINLTGSYGNATFSGSHTISSPYEINGHGGQDVGTGLTGTLTLNSDCTVKNINYADGRIEVNDAQTLLVGCWSNSAGELVIDAPQVRVIGCRGGTVTVTSNGSATFVGGVSMDISGNGNWVTSGML